MSRPRILDLCCGAGAVSRGYHVAGWEPVGVDIEPQPNYPFAFIQADATTIDQRFVRSFDAVHASPPCLRDTVMRHAKGAKGDSHPLLIPPIRALLKASGLPYVLENVMGAALIDPVILNGFMFGLSTVTSDGTRYHLERARKFETNWPLSAPVDWSRQSPVIGVYGAHVRCRSASAGGRGTRDFVGEDKPRLMREAMGIEPGQTMAEMSQAIPPAYTRYIGARLLEQLATRRAAA